ncbi:asparaginyl-tRNA synthetase [Coniochaeta ligniaria NRRL 30616]|uniref:asparagine--tRNA ligase n=1 Tax=Coniochaeta ligniaria NRRL 30616 TaxID=1408157 RepID=A0A1J7I902_9PEZI|nr:asparaginyl-tRNA synthetase [Coniochaeta ligniaria NRRL 30616]
MAVFYVDEEKGNDAAGTQGAETSPFKTLSQAFLEHGPDNEYLVKKKDDEEYKPAAKAALKKAVNFAATHRKKQEAAAARAEKEAQDKAAREAVLEKAKELKITQDPTLPKPVQISLDETDVNVIGTLRKSGSEGGDGKAVRVLVQGRVQRVAKQGGLIFVWLRRGMKRMQCVLTGDLSKTYDALVLVRETSLEIIGELWELPPGTHAPLSRELRADFFRVVAAAPGGDDALITRVPENYDTASSQASEALLNLRHLTLRHDKPSAVIYVRSVVERAFQTAYHELGVTKVSPPALVQTQVEGGSTLFSLDYYGQPAYLTQSSQLYLETLLPSLGDVYCIEKSFRAEKSLTRRHLSEYTHVEAELDFITFDDLLDHLEKLISRVVDLTLEDPVAAATIKEYNKDFVKPTMPFRRMRYSDAIDWLRERGIKNEEGNDHVFGDDIAEAAERRMTDEINECIMLTHFPAHIKAFYMQRAADDDRVTESVDILMPGVGEIVGGSMRIWDFEELLAAYKREGLDPSPYYWYTDQRKYGSSPHGGFGLGLERFLAWLLKLWTVREACLYPRYMGRCTP